MSRCLLGFTIVHFTQKKGYRALGTIYPIRGNNVTTLRESDRL